MMVSRDTIMTPRDSIIMWQYTSLFNWNDGGCEPRTVISIKAWAEELTANTSTNDRVGQLEPDKSGSTSKPFVGATVHRTTSKMLASVILSSTKLFR